MGRSRFVNYFLDLFPGFFPPAWICSLNGSVLYSGRQRVLVKMFPVLDRAAGRLGEWIF